MSVTSISKAIDIAEGLIQAESEEEFLSAWQLLVDTGMAWSLQGWFGRTAQALLENGYLIPPTRQFMPKAK